MSSIVIAGTAQWSAKHSSRIALVVTDFSWRQIREALMQACEPSELFPAAENGLCSATRNQPLS